MKNIIITLIAFLALTGCTARQSDGTTKEVGFWEGVGNYLEEHQKDSRTGTFLYTQVGRVEFSGAFPVELLVSNKAYPATEDDARIIRESLAPVVAQPVVGPQGQLIYPSIPMAPRAVRIMNSVRGWADREPMPSWVGPVIHERTVVPWNGENTTTYAGDAHTWEFQYEGKRTDRQPYGTMPVRPIK